ncbi:hypothetical protein C8T65DRAFT_37164 [Cerioporus squamosus]|nr:hypothetical protein C8T65DRAFT_37164 [Cerioporus squamosus]
MVWYILRFEPTPEDETNRSPYGTVQHYKYIHDDDRKPTITSSYMVGTLRRKWRQRKRDRRTRVEWTQSGNGECAVRKGGRGEGEGMRGETNEGRAQHEHSYTARHQEKSTQPMRWFDPNFPAAGRSTFLGGRCGRRKRPYRTRCLRHPGTIASARRNQRLTLTHARMDEDREPACQQHKWWRMQERHSRSTAYYTACARTFW